MKVSVFEVVKGDGHGALVAVPYVKQNMREGTARRFLGGKDVSWASWERNMWIGGTITGPTLVSESVPEEAERRRPRLL